MLGPSCTSLQRSCGLASPRPEAPAGARLASPRGLLGHRRQGRHLQARVLAFSEDEPKSKDIASGAARAAAAGPCAAVTFKTAHRVAFGQVLKVVGGLPQLGDWDCDRAPPMQWTEGDQWLLTLQLPAGRHEFKVVLARGGGGGCYDWESGPNRTLQVPAAEASAGGAFTVVCEWGNTLSSLETLPEGDLGLEEPLAGTESDEGSLRPEDLRAEPYSPAGDEGESPARVVGKMLMEGGPGSKDERPHGKTPQMGEGADVALGGEPAGGLKPSTEAAIKKELQQGAAPAAAAGKPGLLRRFLQALTGSHEVKQGASVDEDDYGVGGGPGSSGGSSTGGGSSQAPQNQRGGQGMEQPPDASAATGAAEPSAGLQMAAVAAGLAALPVVVWSEYVLKSTGCGLPPGPSGLLGAAEGVSYLVVGGITLWSLTRKMSTGSGLPAGPAGALGAVEGGSWLAVLAGMAVLGLQWQTYGYIPSALPDSNCFGGEQAGSSFFLADTTRGAGPASGQQLAAAPALTSSQAPRTSSFAGSLRLSAGGPSLPQGNLLFSAAEGVLSQSGSIVQTAETAAAALAAAAAGQPPPAAVAAAMHHLQQRAVQVQQLASVIASRLAGGDVAAQQAALAAQQAAITAAASPAPQLEPLSFQPPRYKVRAALKSSFAALQQNQKLRAMLEPYPLPAVARQAAAAAGEAIEAVEHAAEISMDAVSHEERRARAMGLRAFSTALDSAQQHGEGLLSAAEGVGSRLQAVLPPQLRGWHAAPAAPAPQQDAPAAAAAAASSAKATPASPAKAASASPKGVKSAAGDTAAADSAASKAATGNARPAGISAEMFAGVVADLKEGYAGLWQSALVFDPHNAYASLQQRIEVGQQQAAAAAAANAKAAGNSSTTTTSKPTAITISGKTASSSSSNGSKPASIASLSKTASSSDGIISTSSSSSKPITASSSSSSSKPITASSSSSSKPATASSSSSSIVASNAKLSDDAVPKQPQPAGAAAVARPASSSATPPPAVAGRPTGIEQPDMP